MKFTTIMTLVAVSLTFAFAGCKYNKGAGAGADGAGVSDISGAADINAQSGDLAGALDGRRFEDIYQRCTDVNFAPVYFGFDSTVVPQGDMPKIEAVAQHLQAKVDRVVVIEGHCDERGSHEYNLSLGENRAAIIRNYLVQNGISADRIQTRSYGAEKPAVEGHDESAWCKNRRGEFAIFQK